MSRMSIIYLIGYFWVFQALSQMQTVFIKEKNVIQIHINILCLFYLLERLN